MVQTCNGTNIVKWCTLVEIFFFYIASNWHFSWSEDFAGTSLWLVFLPLGIAQSCVVNVAQWLRLWFLIGQSLVWLHLLQFTLILLYLLNLFSVLFSASLCVRPQKLVLSNTHLLSSVVTLYLVFDCSFDTCIYGLGPARTGWVRLELVSMNEKECSSKWDSKILTAGKKKPAGWSHDYD